MEFDRTPIELLSSRKPFTDNGKPIGFTALDYWRFQFSNVWDVQEEVAEFLVAKALGMEKPFNKNGWTPYDIDYCGKRIEVKATAYFHSWRGDGKVSQHRTFGIPKTHGQHNEYTEIAERKNDVYVFCLNLGETKEDSDPFELSHWEFYVIPTSVINNQFDGKEKISLKDVRRITNKVPYSELKSAIDSVQGV